MRLILASTSPRRKQILADAGYTFECADPGTAEDEVLAAPTPAALAVAKARAKALGVAKTLRDSFPAIVIGADTLVSLNGEVLGKPLDRNDAKCILSRLSGTRHEVISGLCISPALGPDRVLPPPPCWVAAVSTWVTMRTMTPDEIAAYVASGESDGKAGAYAMQERGDRFVLRVDGSFANVVGFPIETFRAALPRLLNEWKIS
jgi:septum formation protein